MAKGSGGGNNKGKKKAEQLPTATKLSKMQPADARFAGLEDFSGDEEATMAEEEDTGLAISDSGGLGEVEVAFGEEEEDAAEDGEGAGDSEIGEDALLDDGASALLDQAADDEAPFTRIIDPSSLKSLSSKVDRSGVLYLSRIPPGMGPGKVKHLLEKWGKVGRVYLARDEADQASMEMVEGKGKGKKKNKEKHMAHRFKEGWVEMEDKKVAKRVAELLNARPIGGKPSSPYAQDLWSLTYLPRFKWSHLSDQMALERASRQQLLRTGLEQSRREQVWYLDMVERARVQGKMEEKEEARKGRKREREAGEGERDAGLTEGAKEGKKKKKEKLYRQREALAEGKEAKPAQSGSGKDLSAVLDNLF